MEGQEEKKREFVLLKMEEECYEQTMDLALKSAALVESIFMRVVAGNSPLAPDERRKVRDLFVDVDSLTKLILGTLEKDRLGERYCAQCGAKRHPDL